jgi:hypothetical protein
MDGEHLWSDWMARLVGIKSQFTFRRFAGGPNSPIIASWKKNKLDWKAYVVCKPCNNGWMSVIDNEHAKPTLSGILRGRATCFLERGIASMAVFAFKTAVVADQMNASRRPFFSPFVREEFKRTQRIPPHVQMWFAAYYTPPGVREGIFKTYYLQIKGGRNKGFEFYIFTYAMSPFVVQFAASRWMKQSPRRLAHPVLIQHDNWNPVAAQFWPAHDSRIMWPPPTYLDSNSIDVFTYERWKRLVEASL